MNWMLKRFLGYRIGNLLYLMEAAYKALGAIARDSRLKEAY
jgi:hypothetical protein